VAVISQDPSHYFGMNIYIVSLSLVDCHSLFLPSLCMA
jgi:hypothetical protein